MSNFKKYNYDELKTIEKELIKEISNVHTKSSRQVEDLRKKVSNIQTNENLITTDLTDKLKDVRALIKNHQDKIVKDIDEENDNKSYSFAETKQTSTKVSKK